MARQKLDEVLEGLSHVTPLEGEQERWSLESRMVHYGVPAVSIAVIDEGRLAWSVGVGHVDVQRSATVDEHTLFQAASMSKPVAALALLREVDEGRFELDAPINNYLSSWSIPENDLTRRRPVTLRQIMSHTAGLTVWGFGGYAHGNPLPTLPQILSGSPPANSPEVFVDTLPGTVERYSGGGTTVGQLALQEARAQPYEQILWSRVLEPLGMTMSTFAQPLPDSLAGNAAAGHDWNGATVPGRWHTFPEQAAAGLWTTSADYARFLLGLQAAHLDRPGALIGAATTREMATIPEGASNFALGPKIIGRGPARRFQHGGSNVGYKCGSCAFVDGSRGAVVLTNADMGAGLAEEIFVAIARVYQWPDYLRSPRRRRVMSKEQVGAYVGTYELGAGAPFPAIEISADGGDLRYQLGTLPGRAVFSETATRFFSPESLFDTVFELDHTGRATGLRVLDGHRVVLHGTRSC
jgi:CubicO group peptidase (beta-lactamase class C family)